ncbi:MAG TPA: ATP synthase F1 subunit epsilon [bacterium]|nr:ATP synthase F1 subunit epsilon [bacterium]
MAEQLHLRILTPQKEVLSTDASSVVLPGTLGELGILPQHVALVTTLASGILRYTVGNEEKGVAVHYGYAQVRDDQVMVLAEMAEQVSDLDRDRVRSAEQRARESLKRLQAEQVSEEERMTKYEAKLTRALVRQSLLKDWTS